MNSPRYSGEGNGDADYLPLSDINLKLKINDVELNQVSREYSTDKLQRMLHPAARPVSGTRKFDRGLSHLLYVDLHWLDVLECVQYKLGVTVRWCQQHKAPQYLTDCVTPASEIARRQQLYSAITSCAVLPAHLVVGLSLSLD